MGKKAKGRSGKRKATEREKREQVKKLLKITDEEAQRINVRNVPIEHINRGIVLRKKDGKYYKEIAGTNIKKEINSKQYAGHKRAIDTLKDERGRFVKKTVEKRWRHAAKNMGKIETKEIQTFVKENIERLNEYPAEIEEDFHIGSALKRAVDFKDFKIKINGRKSDFIGLLNYLRKVNKMIDDAQAKKQPTPSIFVTFISNDDNETLNIFWSPDGNEED